MKYPKITTASAGTGKTYEVTEQICNMLLSGETFPDRIIATTFTVKAANEIKSRIREKLLEKGKTKEANLINLSLIGTINSICFELLKKFCFEAGISPAVETLDENDSKIIMREILGSIIDEDYLELAKNLYLDGSSGFNVRTPPYLEQIQTIISKLRLNDLDKNKLNDYASNSISQMLDLFQGKIDDHDTKMQEVLEIMKREIESIRTDELKSAKEKRDYVAIESLYRNYKSGDFKWQEWINWNKPKIAQKHFSKDSHEAIQELTSNILANSAYRNDYKAYITKTFEYAGEALDRYQSYKDEKGLLDFTDQEARLHQLIENNTEVVDYLSNNFDLVVVDEFQDVSPLQLSLFVKLAQLVKKNLWVGDPKQSIYSFRDADPELMQGVLNVVPTENKATLSDSYRSRNSLINFANTVFVESFANSLKKEEVVISQADKKITNRAINEEDILKHPVTFLNLEKGNIANKFKQKETLTLKILDIINSELPVFDKKEKSYRPIKYGDISILCRSNAACNEFASYFSKAGIPVSTSTDGLIDEPEIIFTLALLKLMVHRNDTLAKAEVLLYSRFDGDQSSMINDRLQFDNSYEWQEDNYYVEGLNSIRTETQFLSPVRAIEKLASFFRLPELFTSWGNINQRLANIDALLKHANDYQETCNRIMSACTNLGFLECMNDLSKSSEDKGGEQSGNAIKVMTYHQSKGLEWSMVFMWDLDFSLKDRLYGVNISKADEFNALEPLANREIRLSIKGFNGSTNIDAYDSLVDPSPSKIQAQELATEEEKRLFYVGATRAKDYLYICTAQDKFVVPELINPNLNVAKLSNDFHSDAFKWMDEPIKIRKESLPIMRENDLESYNKRHDRRYSKEVGGRKVYDALRITPSSLPAIVGASIDDIIEIHQRIDFDRDGVNDADFGNLMHSLLAAFDLNNELKSYGSFIKERLTDFGWSDKLDSQSLAHSIHKFYHWLDQKYEIKSIYKELPVSEFTDKGNIINAVIDLCIETEKGIIIIDHKTFSTREFNQKAYENKALSFSGQISCYKELLTKGFGKPVIQSFIYFLLEGKMFKLNHGS